MAEGKKKLYNRDTGSAALKSLCNQLSKFTDYSLMDKIYLYEVTDAYVFGSYLNGVDKIHDLDIAINYVYNTEMYPEDFEEAISSYMHEYYPDNNYSFFTRLERPLHDLISFLKNRKGIISFHTIEEINSLDGECNKKWLMKNGRLTNYAKKILCDSE